MGKESMIIENKLGDYIFKNKVTFNGNNVEIGEIILPDNLIADLEEKYRLQKDDDLNEENKEVVTPVKEKEIINEDIVETKVGDLIFKNKVTFYGDNTIKIGKVILPDNI